MEPSSYYTSGSNYLEIAGIRSYGCHGVMAFEKKIKQLFIADLDIWFDMNRSFTTDDISDTIDYSLVTSKVSKIIEQTSYNLLEALANKIMEEIMGFAIIKAAKLSLVKQAPPVGENIGYVKVVLFRENTEKPNL